MICLLDVYMVGGNILCVYCCMYTWLVGVYACVYVCCACVVCACSVQQLCGHALTVTSLLLFCVLGSRPLCPPPPPLTTCSNSNNYGILLCNIAVIVSIGCVCVIPQSIPSVNTTAEEYFWEEEMICLLKSTRLSTHTSWWSKCRKVSSEYHIW